MGYTESEIACACVHPYAFVVCPRPSAKAAYYAPNQNSPSA